MQIYSNEVYAMYILPGRLHDYIRLVSLYANSLLLLLSFFFFRDWKVTSALCEQVICFGKLCEAFSEKKCA